MGGCYSIREIERRIDPNDRRAYSWEEFRDYYTWHRGWLVYQARNFWDELEIARPYLLE